MPTAAWTSAFGLVVGREKEKLALSPPPLHAPPVPWVFTPSAAPTGSLGSAPAYRVTTNTAFFGAEARVAVTGPFAPGAPNAHHSETPVWLRPAHWSTS